MTDRREGLHGRGGDRRRGGGRRREARRRFRGRLPVPANDLAGGAVPLAPVVGVLVRKGVQPEDRDEREERDERSGAGSPGGRAERHEGGG